MRQEKVLFYVLIGWIAVIWINSLLPGDVSSVQSGFVTGIFQDVVNFFGYYPDPNVLSNIIRTVAHGVEFFILGGLTLIYSRVANIKFLYIVWLGLGVSLIDEIIQIFIPGRAFELKDLLVDNLGFIIGFVILIYIMRPKSIKSSILLEEKDES
ncbi:MAG TPA: VanZ family protein [Acholeplasmataceae bacterium]|nr:VanZ family protein [Acholeplasmataceae bacterium]